MSKKLENFIRKYFTLNEKETQELVKFILETYYIDSESFKDEYNLYYEVDSYMCEYLETEGQAC